jgi:hypothetical protein
MKRADLIRHLESYKGFLLSEGRKHSLYRNSVNAHLFQIKLRRVQRSFVHCLFAHSNPLVLKICPFFILREDTLPESFSKERTLSEVVTRFELCASLESIRKQSALIRGRVLVEILY